ncbi:MAG TPA: hypothetical protein VG435_05105 [Acidimicrobiales bacterium]|jgi:hypothetical protein|nr:hypothetical protein [Acidimicrobiales bacterium]
MRRLPAGLAAVVVVAGCATTPTHRNQESLSFYFRPVLCTVPPYSATGPPVSATPPTVSPSVCSSPNEAEIPTSDADGALPTNPVIVAVDPNAFGTSALRYALGPADMTGAIVSRADAQEDATTGQYSVAIALTSSGAVQFDRLAASRYACYEQDTSNPPYCSLEAFELNGVVESAPTFQASTFNGSISITGDFTRAQALALAAELNAAAKNRAEGRSGG